MNNLRRYIYSFIVLIFLFLFASPVKGQLLDLNNGKIFDSPLLFNSDFIRKAKIKNIKGKILNYQLGDGLHSTDAIREFYFDRNGNLILEYESSKISQGDTIVRQYAYDERGNWIQFVQFDRYGYFIVESEFDEVNRIISQTEGRIYTKEKLTLQEIDVIKYSKNIEYYTYEKYGEQTKQIILNDSKIPYKEKTLNYNEDGHFIGSSTNIIRTSKSAREQLFYNDLGRLDTLSYQSKIGGELDYKYVFGYDEKGRLLKKEEHRNNEYVIQYQIIYKDNINLISDILIQDRITNGIQVIELRNYAYYD